MKPINSHNYSIYFKKSGYDKLNELILKNKYSKIFVLVDENTEANCLNIFKSQFINQFTLIIIDSGEKNKNLATCTKVWNFLNKNNADRKSILINLGGGVITDMGGFIASTYKRGIDFINIPTTLLSIVDASVGSKTGINYDSLKNQIGTFSDPKLVIIDDKYLDSLDDRNKISGYAEIFKHSLISGNLFDELVSDSKTLYNDEIIHNSIKVKDEIVKKDREESNIRKYLNFGHTIGHAIESLKMGSNNELLHGEAIASGLIIELYISHLTLGFPLEKVELCTKHINNLFPKIKLTDNEIIKLYQLMKFDKKNYKDNTNFVLLKDVGSCVTDQTVIKDSIDAGINYYLNN